MLLQRHLLCAVFRLNAETFSKNSLRFLITSYDAKYAGSKWPSNTTNNHTSSLDTDLTRNTRATHFIPQHWLLCHMGLY